MVTKWRKKRSLFKMNCEHRHDHDFAKILFVYENEKIGVLIRTQNIII